MLNLIKKINLTKKLLTIAEMLSILKIQNLTKKLKIQKEDVYLKNDLFVTAGEVAQDLGVSKQDLLSVCTAIISQRLYSNGDKKVCIYEIMDQKTLDYVVRYGKYPQNFKTLSSKISEGIKKGYIMDTQAEYDCISLS